MSHFSTHAFFTAHVVSSSVGSMWLYSVLCQIDLSTFLTLTDQDLKDLGISTFGARRKMLTAIAG